MAWCLDAKTSPDNDAPKQWIRQAKSGATLDM
jgi:hypothetical protein